MFISLAKAKAGTRQERIARRVGWRYPEGMRVVAEYWLATDNPNVIIVSEADSMVPIFAAMRDWDDVFDITVCPAVTAEEGIKMAQQAVGAAGVRH